MAAILAVAKTCLVLCLKVSSAKGSSQRVRVSTKMRMVRVHVGDHAAWSEDQMELEMDWRSGNHDGLAVRWDFS